MSATGDSIHAYRQCITGKRLRNVLQCVWSYALSRMGILSIRHRPTFVAIEPADWCMLHCPECPIGTYNAGKSHHLFSIGQLDKFLQENAETLHSIIFHFQGEPLLNKALPAMIHLAKEYNLYTMLSTNGQLLNRTMASEIVSAGLDRIVVSIDGLQPSSYGSYRIGGSVEKALLALRYLQEEKRGQKANMVVELQCLRLRSNVSDRKILKQRYRDLGADVLTLKTAQFYNYENGHPLMPLDANDSRYKKDKSGHYVLRKKIHNHCYRLWSGCVIDAEGNVLPCCFDKDKQYIFGNITQTSLHTIWKSDAANRYRQQVLHNRKAIGICCNCTE